MKEKSLWTEGKARKRFSLLSLSTVVSIVMILTSLILTRLASAPPLPIGDPAYLQTNPFESNPGSVANNAYIYPAPTPETRGYVKDGLLSTNLNWRIGYYSSAYTGYVEAASFESAPAPFTIGWVDIKICYQAPATTDDRYRIDYQVSPSTSWQILQNWVSGSAARFDKNGQPDERAWSNVAEPNDGVWDWTDISNFKVRVQTQRQGTTEDSSLNLFYLYEVWLTIYEGSYPLGPSVSIQPQAILGPHAGDDFFADVFVTNIAQMVGFQFDIEYDPHILTATEFFSYSPFPYSLPSAANVANVKSVYLYVDGFDNAKTGWTRVGASPYVGTVDYPINYLSETIDGSAIGDFSFSDITSPYHYTSITLEMNIRGDGDDQVEIWLYDGTAWTLAETATPTSPMGDYVLVGPEPPEYSLLTTPGSLDKFDDLDFSGTWDVGEPAIRDVDDNGVYYEEVDIILTQGAISPTTGDPLGWSGSNDKFYDANGDLLWTPGEPAIKDINNNNVYDTVHLTWTSVYVGQTLNTLDKINNAKVYLVKKTVDAPGEIIIDAMRFNLATGYTSVSFCTYFGDPAGFTGSGPVLRVYFRVNADGRSRLHFTKTILSTPLGERMYHTLSDAVFATTAADIAVKSVTPSKTIIGQGYDATVDVSVENQGAYTETFDVTAYYDSNAIGTQRVNDLLPGNTITLPFTWDTTGVAKGSYTLSASAAPVLAETDTLDNTYNDGTVAVTTPGDVNADGIVNMVDISAVSAHWYPGPPIGPLGYDSNCDVNGDGAINMLEISLISAYWTGPPKGPLAP